MDSMELFVVLAQLEILQRQPECLLDLYDALRPVDTLSYFLVLFLFFILFLFIFYLFILYFIIFSRGQNKKPSLWPIIGQHASRFCKCTNFFSGIILGNYTYESAR